MATFEIDELGEVRCKKCGSKDVSIKSGMTADRCFCNDCNNEDYL